MSAEGSKRTALKLVGVVVMMAAFAWAFIPMYNLFCKVTGFGGTTGVAEQGVEHDKILDQTITIKFDASRERGMPWEFKPVQPEMTLKIGETGLAFYEAYNPTDRVIGGTASYNVQPYSAGGYFIKIECFCFTEQVLKPHERVQMPVSFFVDPSIVDDPEARFAKHITLSYTMHETEVPEDQANLATEPATDVN